MKLIHVPRYVSVMRLIRLLSVVGAEELVLKLPWRSRAFRSQLDFDLLALYAREHQLRLLLVIGNANLRGLAEKAGFQVAAQLPEEMQSKETAAMTAAGREPAAGPSLHVPNWLLAMVFFAVVIGAAFAFWPRPRVIVTAARQRVAIETKAKASAAFRESQIAQGKLPAKVLRKSGLITVEFTPSGIRVEGITPAVGAVTFLNSSTERIVVPAGTIVQAGNGLRYRTRAAATVPPAVQEKLLGLTVGVTSGRAAAPIIAEQPGSAGNLPEGRINIIVGPLSGKLRVINTAATSGGTDHNVTVVTAGDLEKARLEAKQRMELEASEVISALAGSEQILLEDSLSFTPGPIKESAAVDEACENLRLTMPYEAKCLTLAKTTLAKFLQAYAEQHVPPYFHVAAEPFNVEPLRAAPLTPDLVELSISASYAAVGRIERRRVLAALCGRTEAQARAVILGLPEVAGIQMELPRGGRFPRFTWQIRLITPKSDVR